MSELDTGKVKDLIRRKARQLPGAVLHQAPVQGGDAVIKRLSQTQPLTTQQSTLQLIMKKKMPTDFSRVFK